MNRLLPMLAIALAASQARAAQDVVYVHGILSSGETWQQAADRISHTFVTTSTRPDLTSLAFISIQAGQLLSDINGISGNAIAVGHSNGGLVLRDTAGNRGYQGLITIGTLHQGAPLMANGLNGNIPAWGNVVATSVVTPFNYYADLAFSPFEDFFFLIARPFVAVMSVLGAGLGAAANHIGIATPALGFTVATDMVPGSDLINFLDSPGHLAIEQSYVGQRVGIASLVPTPLGLTWKAVVPSLWLPLTSFQYASAGVFLLMFSYYATYFNFDDPLWLVKIAGADLWLQAAEAVLLMDPVWCGLVGTDSLCLSDAVVPFESQLYPGAAINYIIVGPSHTEETRSDELFSQLSATLNNDFHVATCAGSRLQNVTLSPSSMALNTGQASQLTAQAFDLCNNLTPSTFSWFSDNPAVASVNATGLVTAVAAGSTNIAATVSTAGGSMIIVTRAPITVTARLPPPPPPPPPPRDPNCPVSHRICLPGQ